MVNNTYVTPRSRYHGFRDGQSYRNIIYLLTSFPLGLAYFIFLVPFIVLSTAMLIVLAWIGVFLLSGMIRSLWGIAGFERSFTMRLLHVSIAPLHYPFSKRLTILQRLSAQVSNPITWKILVYLLLKFPLGIMGFVITVVLLLLSIPLGIVGLIFGLLTGPFYALIMSALKVSNSGAHLRRYLLFSLTGFGLNSLTILLLNGFAFVLGQLARSMLGMSNTALRLEEAERLAVQERARADQAEQRRRQLVVNVSHELRTPVANISGHLESLLISMGDDGMVTPPATTLHNYLTIAHRESLRLGLLVDDLLALARMESSEFRLNLQPVMASEVIEEVYQTLMPLARRQRQVSLVRGAAANLPPVLVDRHRLVQILLNLVRNAIASTSAGGIVSMTMEPADAYHLVLIVADSGVGIPADECAHIFDRFYRTDGSRSRDTGGFGLGLAIVHDLVIAMGGTIGVESVVGQGTIFSVALRTVA